MEGNPVSYTDPFGLSPSQGWLSVIGHGILGIVGCIPGPVGCVANAIDAVWYFCEGDILSGSLALLSAVSMGAASWAKLAATSVKATKTALYVAQGANLLSSTIGTISNGNKLWDSISFIHEQRKAGNQISAGTYSEMACYAVGTVLSIIGMGSSAAGLKHVDSDAAKLAQRYGAKTAGEVTNPETVASTGGADKVPEVSAAAGNESANSFEKYRKASLWERLTTKKADVNDLYANPLDEFSNPKIGPNDSAVSRYINEINTTGKISSPIEVQKLSTGGYEIVNGHHRWLAAIKVGLKTVPIKISNYAN